MSKKKKNLDSPTEEIEEVINETFDNQTLQGTTLGESEMVGSGERINNTQTFNSSSTSPNEPHNGGALFGVGSLRKTSQLSAWASLTLPLLLPVLWLLTLLSSGDAYTLMMKVTIIVVSVNFLIALTGVVSGVIVAHNEREEKFNSHTSSAGTQENTERGTPSQGRGRGDLLGGFETWNLANYLTPSVFFNGVALGVSVYASLVLVIVTQWPVVA